jgi:hypothetical protein
MNPDSTDRSRANEQARQAWDQNAEFWDLRMSEGNDFVDALIWPAVEYILASTILPQFTWPRWKTAMES